MFKIWQSTLKTYETILDHLSRKVELQTFETIKVWLQFQHFKYSLLAFQRFSKSLKIWKSELNLSNVTGTSYHWCHLITDVNDAIMHQLPNEPTKLLNIFKNLWMVWYAQLQ